MGRPKENVTDTNLTTEKDNSKALLWMRVDETATISPEDKFVILPGPKGEGWILRIVSPIAPSN